MSVISETKDYVSNVLNKQKHALEERKEKRALKRKMAKLQKGEDQTARVNIGYGFNLDKPEKGMNLSISNAVRTSGLLAWGTTRIGKSRLAESLIEQDIMAGRSVCLIDPKQDYDLFNKIVHMAREAGRMKELILVTPIYPEVSAIIDPLSSFFMVEEIIGHIISGISANATGDAKFFYDYAQMTASNIVHSLVLLDKYSGKQPSFNLSRINKYASHNGLKRLREEVECLDKDDQQVQDMLSRLESQLDEDPQYTNKVMTSLKVVLAELTTGSIGRIIGKADENRFIDRLENDKPVIMVVHLGALLANQAAYTTGKIILSMIQSMVGRKHAMGKKITPDLCLYIDEFHTCVYPGFATLLSMCGSANLKVHLFNQTIHQLTSAVGEELTLSIIDNINTKIFMRIPDSETALYISRHLGEEKTWSPMMSMGGAVTIREMEDMRVKPSQIMKLGPREFYMHTYTGLYRGKTLDVLPSPLEVDFSNLAKRSHYV